MNISEKIKALTAEARAIVADADTNKGAIRTEDHETKDDETMTQITGLEETLKRQQALDKIEAGLTAAQPRLISPDPATPPAPTPGINVTPGAADPSGGFAAIPHLARACKPPAPPGVPPDPRAARTGHAARAANGLPRDTGPPLTNNLLQRRLAVAVPLAT